MAEKDAAAILTEFVSLFFIEVLRILLLSLFLLIIMLPFAFLFGFASSFYKPLGEFICELLTKCFDAPFVLLEKTMELGKRAGKFLFNLNKEDTISSG